VNRKPEIIKRPQILAPAGNRASFLAAIAAGADAVYCGLKVYSARMEAKNFTVEDLAPLSELAHEKGVQVFVAINSVLKNEDLSSAGTLVAQLEKLAKPDGLIIQDLALADLARQAGFSGELHLSTLANLAFPSALKLVKEKLGINRIVIPRELSIDEIKALSEACPEDLSLEVFVHGALCYGISGRCYWSSYLGGKSGLRGRCVQPCRRIYTQGGRSGRFFSCVDLSLDVLSRVLLPIPEISAWKIEGRKKGPHYVYYTATAYKILRDSGNDPKMKKTAVELLERALGRKGTHYHFLPQRQWNPVAHDGQTGSGLLMGKIQGPKQNPYFVPREELVSGDLLRIGYEDESSYGTVRVGKYVPPRGRLYIKLPSGKNPVPGAPVFLTDRREKVLDEMISELEGYIKEKPVSDLPVETFTVRLPKRNNSRPLLDEVYVQRDLENIKGSKKSGFWIGPDDINKMERIHDKSSWLWLPPVIWPDEEIRIRGCIDIAVEKGSRNFVLNAPWQIELFGGLKGLNIWAGPFCNISNVLAVNILKSMNYSGVIISPELGADDYLLFCNISPLPLGIVISGNWPLTMSRVLSDQIEPVCAFTSPKGEQAWIKRYGSNFWVYPNWKIDLTEKKKELQKAGCSMFIHLAEPVPDGIEMKTRKGLWNWDLGLA
jgi:U32 family peptidase